MHLGYRLVCKHRKPKFFAFQLGAQAQELRLLTACQGCLISFCPFLLATVAFYPKVGLYTDRSNQSSADLDPQAKSSAIAQIKGLIMKKCGEKNGFRCDK